MLMLLRRLFLQCVRLWHSVVHVVQWICRVASRPHLGYRQTVSPRRWYRAQPKPAWVRREITRLKALMPDAGCRTIAHVFNRRFAVTRRMTVGKTYVAYTVRGQQYAILCTRRKLKHAIPRPVPRNLIWGLDLMVKTDTQGRQHLVLAVLDHASRACLRLQRLRDKSALTLLRHLNESIQRYGRPRYVRTDNEAVFTSRLFRFALRFLGITPQRTDPGCPWQNGRAERFFGTLKATLDQWHVDNGEQLGAALARFRCYYNHVRPHQHLQGRTPAEVWAGVDVFTATPQAAVWRKAWHRHLRAYCGAMG